MSGKGPKNDKKNGNKAGGRQQPAAKPAFAASVSTQKREPAPTHPAPASAARPAATPSAALPAGDWLQPEFDIGKGTLQQQRAAFALQATKAWVDKPVEVRKKLNSYAAKMPFMVHANGLGQTAEFYRAKGEKDPHHDLYRLLGAWLTRPDQPFSGSADLLAGIVAADLHTYVAAQAEAMLFLGWVKQFAAAFLESE